MKKAFSILSPIFLPKTSIEKNGKTSINIF
jgi:hypothetical protein